MKECSLERLQYDSIYGIYDIWKRQNCSKSKKTSGRQRSLKERERTEQVKHRGFGGSEILKCDAVMINTWH